MADERNDSMSGEQTAAAPAPASPAEPAATEAAAPRRRTRKTKKEADAVEAPASPAGGGAPSDDAPARSRSRKKAEPAEVSPEVAQARALAQISQAQVVRRQRREEQAAAELIASPGEGAEAPAKPARTRSRKKAEPAEQAAADTQAAAAPIEIPAVDPALRPHRRGRKPKAYVEAERAAAAAAAALAQQQAAEGPSAQPAPAPEKDVKPGRGRRAKGAPAEERSADAGKAAEDGAKPSKASRAEAREKAPQPGRDAKEGKEPKDAKDGGKGADQHAEAAEGGSREGRRRHDRASRNQERNGGRQRADRAERNRNGKRGNRYNVPNEPTLTREELAACKVAELREKARELDLDVTGKKKAELVEEIYTAAARAEGFRDIEGILEIANEGFGYIRAHGYMPSRDDAFVPANLIRAARLRSGDLISGTLRPSRANDKYPGLAKIHTVNGLDPEQIRHRPKFSELTPIYPNEPLKMEHGRESITGRAIDIVSPIGKGQRGLIVSPPKAGKTTVLKHICQSIAINNPEVHLICLLVDERPEEVTDMERSIKGDVVASTFDMPADNHTRVSELVIERAKRIVEMGGDVVVVLDSITRLARAYNLAAPASGRILSGGVDSAALYPPKRFLGAARNIENGGSLTILASALVDTGSKMDEVIFEEFKGTGNMELKLDRDLADRRIFPAIDPVASGTRNEDLLVDENMRPFVWGIRRILANMSNTERAAASFIKGLKGTNSNEEFLIRTAKKAADHPEAL